jgi:hypothetical protein
MAKVEKILKSSVALILVALCFLNSNLPGESRSRKQKSEVIKNKIVNPATKQEFVFLGCPGSQGSFKDVANVLIGSQIAWNNHKVDEMISFYSPNFTTKDGMDIEKVKKNLKDFWYEYPDAKLVSYPAVVYVCGGQATVTLSEYTEATGQPENPKLPETAPKFKGWIQGVTVLKKVGSSWKITTEEILSENMWKYYGSYVEELLSKGDLTLVVPSNVYQSENYIAQLKYNLPEGVKGVALLDKVLLTEFPVKEQSKLKSSEQKGVLNPEEIEAIRRTIDGDGDGQGLRRMFVANNLGQDELVRAQVELIKFEQKGPVLLGLVGLSQRVAPRGVPQEDKGDHKQISKTFKEESSTLKD